MTLYLERNEGNRTDNKNIVIFEFADGFDFVHQKQEDFIKNMHDTQESTVGDFTLEILRDLIMQSYSLLYWDPQKNSPISFILPVFLSISNLDSIPVALDGSI